MTGSKHPRGLAAVRLDGGGHGVAGDHLQASLRACGLVGRYPELLGRVYQAAGRACLRPEESPSPEGQTDVGVLGLRVDLEPGMSGDAAIRACAGAFRTLPTTWNREDAVKGKRLGNWYVSNGPMPGRRPYACRHRERMEQETRAYSEAVFYAQPAGRGDRCRLGQRLHSAHHHGASNARRRMNGFEGCGDSPAAAP